MKIYKKKAFGITSDSCLTLLSSWLLKCVTKYRRGHFIMGPFNFINEAYKQNVVDRGGGGSMPAEDAAYVTTRKNRTLLSKLAFKKISLCRYI